jgi:hypothetical protein
MLYENRRTQFSDEDEEHLCSWIAQKIPYKETGGRTGNRLYQQLCDLVRLFHPSTTTFLTAHQSNDPEYAWVSRHTWQSWRERYKKNAIRLDQMIAAIVEQKKPAQGEKGQYGYVRKAEDKPKRSRRKRGKNLDLTDDYSGEYLPLEGKGEGLLQIMPPQMMYPSSSMQIHGLPAPGGGPLDLSTIRKSPAEEEMDDTEENSEWIIRVGTAPPPSWGKRKTTEEASEEGSQKRLKTRQGTFVLV